MRHIDHIVVAVRDLDQAADLYRRLGFKVGPRNQHPWGTENRLIQFAGSFMELITLGGAAELIVPHRPRQFSFGAFVQDFLNRREGVAMLALRSADAAYDAAAFAAQRIGDFDPFFFQRNAKKPDGSLTEVAFTLAFAADPAAPDAGFFVCQQHYPENFWNTEFQRHPNGAEKIAAVTLATPDPGRHEEFLTQFTGAQKQLAPERGLRFALERGRLEVVSAADRQTQPLLTSMSVRVRDLGVVARLLGAEGVPFTTFEEQIVLAPKDLLGVELQFEAR